MLVYVEQQTPRTRYVIEHVFGRMLGWELEWAEGRDEFIQAEGPKLVYGSRGMDGAYHVPDSGWLRGTGVPKGEVPCSGTGKEFRTFVSSAGQDLFASIFHLLALVDEIRCGTHDQHGRVPAEALLIVKHKAESTPLVDRWVLELATALRAMFPALPVPRRSFRHVLTVDVDNGLKYVGRPFHRAVGASLKDIRGSGKQAVAERWSARRGVVADPYAILPQRMEEVRAKVDRAIVFFLMRGGGRYDHAADHRHPAFVQLVQEVGRHGEIGLHPSYGSSDEQDLMVRERRTLEGIHGAAVRINRQHFLRWRMPETLRRLADQGFTEDHTLGFTDRVGFRAGTCTPFPWFDLERNEETGLMLWPFAVMDSAIREHLKLSVEQAEQPLKAMSEAVRMVDGTFVSVWHDRYLSGHREFVGWPELMKELVQHLHR